MGKRDDAADRAAEHREVNGAVDVEGDARGGRPIDPEMDEVASSRQQVLDLGPHRYPLALLERDRLAIALGYDAEV